MPSRTAHSRSLQIPSPKAARPRSGTEGGATAPGMAIRLLSASADASPHVSDDALTPAAARRKRENALAAGRIMSAARKLFVRYGFENVSMRQIAAAAKYTPGALYVHFQDKHTLIFTMMQLDFRAFDASMQDACQIADPVSRLRELGRGYVRFALEHPHHYKLMFMTEPPAFARDEMSKENCQHANSDREGYNLCRLTVADCIAQHRFAPQHTDIELVSQATWGCVHGIVSLFITHGKMPWTRFSDPLAAAYSGIDIHLAGLTRGARVASHIDSEPTATPTTRSTP